MASFVQFLIVVAAIATVYGQQLNVTNSPQDFLFLSQRDLLHRIEIAELEVAAVDTRYADRLDTIEYDQQQALNLIQQLNQTLTPLQALSLVRKHCIQKFDSQLTSYNAAKLRFDTCNNKARNSGLTLTSNAKSSVTYARSYVTNTLPRNAANCNTYKNNQTRYEECYEDTIASGTKTVDSYLTQAEDQLEKSLFDANVLTRTAVQCSFIVEKDVLDNNAFTTKLIDDCEYELNKKKSLALAESFSEPRSIPNLIMGKVSRVNN